MTLQEILARLANPQAPGASPPVPPSPTIGATQGNLAPAELALTPPLPSRALIEPDLLTQMQGGYTQSQLPQGAILQDDGSIVDERGAPWPITRRPNVLPFTVDAATGQLTWAMPRALDLVGALQGGPAVQAAGMMPKLAPGEAMLGTFGKGEAFDVAAVEHAHKLLKEGKIDISDLFSIVKKAGSSEIHDAPSTMGPPIPTQAQKDIATLYGSVAKANAKYFELAKEASAVQKKMNSPNWAPADLLKYKQLKAEMEEIGDLLNDVPAQVPGVDAGPGATASPPTYTPYEKRPRRLMFEDQFVGPPDPRRELSMEPLAVADRAAQLGFDPQTFYTGMGVVSETQPRSFRDPQLGKDERAIFLTDRPEIAETYGDTIFPTKVRFGNTMDVDWKEAVKQVHGAGYKNYDAEVMSRLIDEAIAEGYDSLKLRGMFDQGGKQDQFVVFNPNQLRSPWARFDPMLKDSADLTSALIPPGLLMELLRPREQTR